MSQDEKLIQVVDENDKVIGAMPMDEAKQQGKIHRIARVIAEDSKGRVLLQKRSKLIPSPGLWDNSSAGHVDEGETYEEAARRETFEEIGVENVSLELLKTYYYEENDSRNRDIRQFNRVFKIKLDYTPDKLNPDEVTEVKWFDLADLKGYINDRPEDFTAGFIRSIKECFSL